MPIQKILPQFIVIHVTPSVCNFYDCLDLNFQIFGREALRQWRVHSKFFAHYWACYHSTWASQGFNTLHGTSLSCFFSNAAYTKIKLSDMVRMSVQIPRTIPAHSAFCGSTTAIWAPRARSYDGILQNIGTHLRICNEGQHRNRS